MSTTATHDPEAIVDGDPDPADTDDGSALFDGKQYDIPVPKLDGHRADTLKLAFGGNVEIDSMIEDNLDHFKSLRFGQEVDLVVTGIVGKHGWTIRIDPESGDEKVTHTVGIAVHSYEAV